VKDCALLEVAGCAVVVLWLLLVVVALLVCGWADERGPWSFRFDASPLVTTHGIRRH